MKKYKVLKELPGYKVGDEFTFDTCTFGREYLIEHGFAKEVRDIDLFVDELKKLMVKYGFKQDYFKFLYFEDSNGDAFRI